MSKPKPTDFPEYFGRYISLVDADSLQAAVKTYSSSLDTFYSGLPEAKADYAYAPGKWTVKEVLQHMIDAERVFTYRILRISRKDKTPLASFDENVFAEHSHADQRSLASLKEEFAAVRKSTDLLIASLDEEQLAEQGIASNNPVTANAIGYIIFGHLLHHKKVLEERYL
ncbi:MAG: DinB family protein [Chitinophagaceae bacterium]|nr:DinB family protein [Chitinophagaceae bacterium]